MSGASIRVPLEQAEKFAADLVALLAPVCTRIEVAGSVRRRRPDVGDLDIVAIPKVLMTMGGLFEDQPETEDLLSSTCDGLAERGVLGKRLDKNGRACWGRELKRATFGGLNVDVQSVSDPDTWGALLLIRTGPALWNRALMTPVGRKFAVANPDITARSPIRTGLLPLGFEFRDGFRLYRYGGQIPTPEEIDVFRALGMEYVEPEDRR